MIIILFQIDNKYKKSCFFQGTFLLADISIDITFRMSFLTLSNVEVNFNNRELKWRLYIDTKAPLTIRWEEFVGKKEFAAVAFDLKNEIFMFHIASFTLSNMSKAYSSYRTQIVFLWVDETPTTVPQEYSNIIDIFSSKLVKKLPKYTRINNHPIDLVDRK